MATYDPPQPIWKRNLAGILDFLLAFIVCGFAVSKLFGHRSDVPDDFGKALATFNVGDASFALDGWPLVFMFALIVAYFVILGQTGGTIFQRLFAMRRSKSNWFRSGERA